MHCRTRKLYRFSENINASDHMSEFVNAVDIPTDLWNDIITRLVAGGWNVIEKYDNFDAGIDYDSLILEKDGERIEFEWTNWTEGELRCTAARLDAIEGLIGQRLRK